MHATKATLFFVTCQTPTSHGASGYSDEFVLTIALAEIKQYGHPEAFVFIQSFGLVDRQDVHFFVLRIQSPSVDFFLRVNIKLVLPLDVLDIFFHFGKIWCQSRPFLRTHHGPYVYTTGF
ncbi:hypothetical protein HG531_001781 [Fusarium graminearum]|nr:hypothetical protein HG531_001781 [Fusarium graminearum]